MQHGTWRVTDEDQKKRKQIDDCHSNPLLEHISCRRSVYTTLELVFLKSQQDSSVALAAHNFASRQCRSSDDGFIFSTNNIGRCGHDAKRVLDFLWRLRGMIRTSPFRVFRCNRLRACVEGADILPFWSLARAKHLVKKNMPPWLSYEGVFLRPDRT